MRHTTILFTAACLALAGCSSASDREGGPKPTATKTVTAPPTLSKAQARAACVAGWKAVMDKSPHEAPAWEDRPAVCEGLAEQMEMYVDASMGRAEENRRRIDECVEDPSCTGVPIG